MTLEQENQELKKENARLKIGLKYYTDKEIAASWANWGDSQTSENIRDRIAREKMNKELAKIV